MRSFFDTLALIVGKGLYVAVLLGFAGLLRMTAHIKPASYAVIASGIALAFTCLLVLAIVLDRRQYRTYEDEVEIREEIRALGYLTLIIFGIYMLARCLVWLAQRSVI